jgi:alpha-mannosidase
MQQVRIKDRMRSAYTPLQWLGVQIEQIRTRQFSTRIPLGNWQIREAIYASPGNYHWLDKDWRAFRIGEAWGGNNRTAFFRCEATVPESLDGHYGVLLIRPGGEGLLTLNGRPFAGLDSKHDVLFLDERLKAGAALKLEIEQTVNEMEIFEEIHRFQFADLAVLDRQIEDGYFDFKCAYELLVSPQCEREAAAFLMAGLKKAMALVQPDRELTPFKESLLRAQTCLRETIYESDKFPREGRLNMVGHSHLDLVYQWDYNEFLRKIGRTHATTLNMMREFPEYLFCQSQIKLYEDLQTYYPDIFERIRQRVKEGRWEVIGGMYVEPDCNLISGESFIRQLQFGRAFTEKEFGTTSSVCWLPDVFGITWILPQILVQSGYRFLITNKPIIWNDTNEFRFNTFWWEGPEGSRILTHLPSTHFGAPIDADVLATNWNEYKQKIECPEVIYNYGYADGRGGPNRDDILTGRRFRQCPGMPEAHFTHGEQAFQRMENKAAGLPLYKDELYLETHRGTYTTQARLKKNNRKAEILFRNAELCSALATLFGKSYPKQELHEGWKLLLKNQFHDILPGSHVTTAYHAAMADYATLLDAGQSVLDHALKFLAEQIHVDRSEPAFAVFNLQPFTRTDRVEVTVPVSDNLPFTLQDDDQQTIAFQIIDRTPDQVRLLLEANVPALGYRTYHLTAGAANQASAFQVSDKIMESCFFRIVFDDDGCICSLFDKTNQVEVIQQGRQANLFQLFQDVPGRYAAWDIVPMYKEREYPMPPFSPAEIIENGPVRLVMQRTCSFYNSKISQRIVLYSKLARIDFETEVDWQERDRLLKVAFPVNVNAMRATYDLSFGFIERPTHQNTTWDAAKFEVSGHKWADLSEGGYGVSLLNDCKYGHDISGQVMRLTLLKGPQYPDPTADLGRHTFTYALYPHQGDWRQASTPQRAWELNDPLQAVLLRKSRGVLAPCASFLAVSCENVLVSAFKSAEKGNELIIRVHENQNQRGPVTISFFKPPARIAECDLNEVELGEAKLDKQGLHFFIKPFEIKTFKLFYGR